MTRTHRSSFSTRTHRSEYCDKHDVSGCNDINCRAQALGMSVSQYKGWVVVPASMTLNAHRKSH